MKKKRVILGIIGETGSGKTTLAQQLKQKLGGQIIEGDKIGHLVLLRQEVIDALISRYTPNILSENSHAVNRKKLGDIVFNDANELLFLNELMHPLIRQEVILQIDSYVAEPYVIIDGAALIEANILPLCDLVLYIKVSSDIRFRRLIEGRKIDSTKASAMIKSQKSSSYFESHASVTYEVNDEDTVPLDLLIDYIEHYNQRQ